LSKTSIPVAAAMNENVVLINSILWL